MKNIEIFFHLTFVVTFLAFTAIRAYYHRQASREAGKVEYKEGRLHTALRLVVGLPWILSLLAYIFVPAWFAWARLALPEPLRWMGVILALISLPLIVWVQQALGANFSTTLHVREQHTLATGGPYRWVRHPMYTVLVLQITSLLLLTSNWLVGGVPLLALLLIVITRIDNEERTMITKFGDQYRAYMQQTGRFLPRWQRKPSDLRGN